MNKITDPKGKIIKNNEKEFFEAVFNNMCAKHHFTKDTGKGIFYVSLEEQGRYGGMFVKGFRLTEAKPYSMVNLHSPWEGAWDYERLNRLFLFQPCSVGKFLNFLNQYFYADALHAWQDIQKISYFPKHSDYCARAFPGSSNKARSIAVELSKTFEKDVESLEPPSLRSFVIGNQKDLFAKRWKQFGGSLFPLGYRLGDDQYGRLKSIPGSTLCNLNKKPKIAILRAIKLKTKISFFEIDLKSCHAKIFEDLFDWDSFERSDLPSLDDLWPEIIKDFWQKANEVHGYEDIKSQIVDWGEALLKGLLKNQFYKALNGGFSDFSDDNVERSKTKLKISSEDQPVFNEFFHIIFSQMKVFKLESHFKEQLNSFPLLYLPNKTEGFPIRTLSKKQSGALLLNPEANFRMQTSNSRIFSNMELCLIMHLFGALTMTKLPWLVVGYEADGVLVAADALDEEEAGRGLTELNRFFQESIKSLTTAEHSLDLKNFV